MTDTATLPETDVTDAGTSIAVVVASNPLVVLLDNQKRSDLYAHIEQEIATFVPDISTAKGRDAIKALAYKITRTKTAIDAAGKALNEEARAKINAVDEARRDSRNTLDILAERVRKPLTEWEEAEKLRVAKCTETIAWLKQAKNVFMEDTAATVRARGSEVYQRELDAETFGDMLAEAQAVKDETVASLKASLARLTKEEADRAELERLRAAEAERAEKEAAERAEQERLAAEAEAERRREEQRIAAEEAEKARIAQAEREAAEKAQREAEEKAEAERAEQQRKHDEELAEQRRIAEEAEQRERDRIAKEEAEAAERARREADQAHRNKVKAKAASAIEATGVSREAADKIVLAIIAGEIPSVRLEF